MCGLGVLGVGNECGCVCAFGVWVWVSSVDAGAG